MSWAMEQQIVTDASARHVLLCLANYADHKGNAAFPSASTLVKDTGLSERTVRLKLDALEQSGIISRGNQAIVAAHIDRSDKRPICYNINISRGADVAGRDGSGCISRNDGVQSTQERGAVAAPNPSYEPSFNPKEEAAPKITFGDNGEWTGISDGIWRAWNAAYPALNLDRELAKAAAWLLANPKNKKSNYARFLTNWFGRAQDSAPRSGGQYGRGDDNRPRLVL